MYKQTFIFISEAKSKTMEVSCRDTKTLDYFTTSLLAVFEGINLDMKNIKKIQHKNPLLTDRLMHFVNSYSTQLPFVKQIAAFYNKLKDNELFLVVPQYINPVGVYLCYQYIKSLRDPTIDYAKIEEECSTLLASVTSSYDIDIFGDYRRNIGESEISNRFCRFCGEKSPAVAFTKKAHAISEAIGNKTLVLWEECDECNDRFSRVLEPDFIDFFGFFRTILNIKGKGGEKKYTGENFKVDTDGKGVNITVDEIKLNERNFPTELHFKSERTIKVQNLYRVLCKYFLSVVPTNEIIHFARTIQWINNEFSANKLPLVLTLDHIERVEQPTLITYLRKSANDDLPYAIGDLSFIASRYIFIIPFCANDSKDIIEPEFYDRVWEVFPSYKAMPFSRSDLSDDTPRKLSHKIKFIMTASDPGLE